MRKVSRRIAVKADALDAQALQQPGHDDAADGVDGVYHHREVCGLDGLHVYGRQGQNGVQMLVGEIFFFHIAQLIYLGKAEVLFFGEVQHGLPFNCGKELAFVVKELEGVPLTGVMAGGDDDAAIGLGKEDGHFRGGGAGEAAFDNVDAAADERAHHQLLYHVTRHAGILAHNYLVALAVGLSLTLGESGGISSRKLDNINGGKGASRGASDGSANTGNGFN